MADVFENGMGFGRRRVLLKVGRRVEGSSRGLNVENGVAQVSKGGRSAGNQPCN